MNNDKILNLWSTWELINTILKQTTPNGDLANVKKLQIDFGEQFVSIYGNYYVTPYVHLIACHLLYFVEKTPMHSIGAWANQGFEAFHQANRWVFDRASSKRGGRGDGIYNWTQLFSYNYRNMVIYNKKRGFIVPPTYLNRFPKFNNLKAQFAKPTRAKSTSRTGLTTSSISTTSNSTTAVKAPGFGELNTDFGVLTGTEIITQDLGIKSEDIKLKNLGSTTNSNFSTTISTPTPNSPTSNSTISFTISTTCTITSTTNSPLSIPMAPSQTGPSGGIKFGGYTPSKLDSTTGYCPWTISQHDTIKIVEFIKVKNQFHLFSVTLR